MRRMQEIGPEQFTATRWRRCDLLAMLGCGHRTGDVLRFRRKLAALAVGWCRGERVPCRPKAGRIAVMFWCGDGHGWTHLLEQEAEAIDAEAT
jgi:hypothetical protein